MNQTDQSNNLPIQSSNLKQTKSSTTPPKLSNIKPNDIADLMESLVKNNEIVMINLSSEPQFKPISEKTNINFFSKGQTDKKLNIDFNTNHQHDTTLELNISGIHHHDYSASKKNDYGLINDIQEEDDSLEFNDLKDLQNLGNMMSKQ